ncbi:hypothetical protein IAU60_005745 [Kwoniella sp. DSM 27419]
MGPSSFPSHLLAVLSAAQTGTDFATDALEEWILHRRSKGDTLFDVSVGLAELEDRTPPHLTSAFDRARYVTNVPQPTDLTPPMGPFPLARSASSATVLQHLLSQPPPSIEHSREVILEYVLAREAKTREKKPGRGGKGTLGRDGFEDIARRLGEIEDGLRGEAPDSSPKQRIITASRSPRDNHSTPASARTSLKENQQIGLTLILSLRMSLSYFTLQEIADQLLVLTLRDAERALVQHIRRRVQGEGRYGVGKELEYVESIVLPLRPALRPASRSARARTLLSARPLFAIPLPAPSKQTCIKWITSLCKEVEANGTLAGSRYIQSQIPPSHTSNFSVHLSPQLDKGYFGSKRSALSPTSNALTSDASPLQATSPLPPPLHTSGGLGSASQTDSDIVASFTLELVSEYLTREKREHILKSKWAKTGREQLGKDLADIESATCLASKGRPATFAPTLLPIFLTLRRTFALSRSTLHPSVIDPYLDILPAPPDPDTVPFREPTVSSTTASLYVNPRMDDASASAVLEELVEYEKESVRNEGASFDQTVAWIVGLIEEVQKRFPDGSYDTVFEQTKEKTARPEPTTSSNPSTPFGKQPSIHRRTQSSAVTPTLASTSTALGVTPNGSLGRKPHLRSLSMPNRGYSLDDSDSDTDPESSPSEAQVQEVRQAHLVQHRPAPVETAFKQLPPLEMLSPIDINDHRSSAGDSAGGWWDIVSAIENDNPAPWQSDNPRKSAGAASVDLPLPPGAEPAQVIDFSSPNGIVIDHLNLDPTTPSKGAKRSSASPRPIGDIQNRSVLSSASPPPRSTSKVASASPAPYSPAGVSPQAPLSSQQGGISPGPARSGTSTPATGSPVIQGVYDNGNDDSPSQPSKSRLGILGRSMSLARHKKESKERYKENEKAGKKSSKAQVEPGKWDRNMVASIMGPPAERR